MTGVIEDEGPSSAVPRPAEPPRLLALATTFDRAARLAPEQLLDRAVELHQRAEVPEARAALAVDAQLDPERLDGLVAVLEKRKALPVLLLEAGSGLRGRPALAALDKEEGRRALAEAEATLRRASALGAAHVVLRLGWVEGARRDWTYARDRYLRAQLGPERAQKLVTARDRVAPGHIDRARAALDRLARTADSLGVVLLVKNGQRYVELPSPAEWRTLAIDLSGAPIAALYDRPAAHLLATMGFAPLALTESALGTGPVRYAGDACGAIAALPPGHGEMGPQAVIASHAVFRPWPQLGEDEVALGLRRLR